MLMRYHWGLAIGHVYSHGQAASITPVSTEAIATASTNDTEPETSAESEVHQSPHRLDPKITPMLTTRSSGFKTVKMISETKRRVLDLMSTKKMKKILWPPGRMTCTGLMIWMIITESPPVLFPSGFKLSTYARRAVAGSVGTRRACERVEKGEGEGHAPAGVMYVAGAVLRWSPTVTACSRLGSICEGQPSGSHQRAAGGGACTHGEEARALPGRGCAWRCRCPPPA